jgi:peptide/nickel transport system substrate-binding protein
MRSVSGGHPRSRFWRRVVLPSAGLLTVALAAGGCGGSSNSNASGSTPVEGGVAVMAQLPSSNANYVFPYMSGNYDSNQNLFDLQNLMYRPLFWFGQGSQPVLNTSLSLAYPPTFNGTKVTIKLKHYMWSNGTQVTASDVRFWLNMETAVPADYGAYTGFPSNVKDITVVSTTELTMVMDKSYNPTWFVYNALSQIVPMPTAWDRTASGPSNCDTTLSDCASVYSYLNKQAQDVTGYATSPIWGIVDGPWRLSAFNADGHITFVPNKKYSGPVKPKLSAFEEVPFTTDSAEYDVLQSPSSSTKIDVGYLPEQDAPAKSAGAAAGANPLASKGYTLAPLYAWGDGFYVMNFQSTTGNGPIMRQLYFRQAMAYLMDQDGVVSGPLRGYGSVSVGPVGNVPVTKFLSPQGRKGVPYPFSIAKAKALLSSHGWKVVSGGLSSCVDPAKCGPGIAKGKTLSFNFSYATGFGWLAQEMTDLQANATQVGIKLNLQPKPITQVLATSVVNCVVGKISCDWDMANYLGTTYSPDYLPTGELTYMTGATINPGGYSNAENDAMIEKTLTSPSLSYMYEWEDYLAMQLPVEWQPDPASQLTEVANNLKGVLPQSSTLSINPENWYFVK